MSKKNIKPQQQQPVVRYNTVKSVIDGLTEENLTQEAGLGCVGAIPGTYDGVPCRCCSFDGDDAE